MEDRKVASVYLKETIQIGGGVKGDGDITLQAGKHSVEMTISTYGVVITGANGRTGLVPWSNIRNLVLA